MRYSPRLATGAVIFFVLGSLAAGSAGASGPDSSRRSGAIKSALAGSTRVGDSPTPREPSSPASVETLDAGSRAVRRTDPTGVDDLVPPTPPPPSAWNCPAAGTVGDMVYRGADTGERQVDPCGNLSGMTGSAGGAPGAAAAAAATIDRMTTSVGYTQTHPAGGSILLFGSATAYTLSDGSTWSSGAGSYTVKSSYLDHVETVGTTVRYVLTRPPDGKTYEQTDFDGGDHSAQGALGSPASLVIEATIGSTKAIVTGSVPIISNDATWYGEPRFNYYSAIPGSDVPFQLTYWLVDGSTWQTDTFARSFSYNCTGWVDFAHPTDVPAVASLRIRGSAQVPPHADVPYAAIARFVNGVERDVASRATWNVKPATVASVASGVLSTGAFDVDLQPVTMQATYSTGGVTVGAEKTVLGRTATTVTGGDSWPMYQADERHTGSIARQYEPDTFRLRWTKRVSTAALNPVAAADGRVFVSISTYFSGGAILTALDAIDGEVLWTQDFGSVFSVNPASAAYGNVYIQTCDHSGDTWLHAFDAQTGEGIFRAPFEAQWERYFAPTIFDGSVYIDGGYYGGMYAFDAFSGTQRWFAGLPQYDEWTPGVAGDLAYAYVGSYTPGLYVFDRRSGRQTDFIADPAFSWNGWSMNLAPLVLDDGDVVAIHDNRLLRFDLTTRTIAWQRKDLYTGQPSLAKGVLYVVDGGRVVALDPGSGGELWSWTPPSGTPLSPFIVTDSHLFVSTASTVYAVDVLSRETAWSYPAGGRIALADDNLYIAQSDGTLVAVAAAPYAPAPPVALEIRGPDQAVEFTSVPYRSYVHYADGRVRDRTRSTTWGVAPATYAAIGADGVLSVQEMLDMAQDVSIAAQYSEAGATVQSAIPVHLAASVTLPAFVERNRARAAQIQAGVLGELDQAMAREQAILRALGAPDGGSTPAPPDPLRAAIVKALAAGQNAEAAVERAVEQLGIAGRSPAPAPARTPETAGRSATGRAVIR